MEGMMLNPVIINIDDQRTYPVRWTTKNNTCYLTKSLKKVPELNHLTTPDLLLFELESMGDLKMKLIIMDPTHIVDTQYELPPLGMTIGEINNNHGLANRMHTSLHNADNHMSLFNALDYMVVVRSKGKGKYIHLSEEFTAMWGLELKSQLLLNTSNNIQRKVHYLNHNGKIWLTQGWTSISDDYNLGTSNDVILFKYNGKSLFDVHFLRSWFG